MDNYREVGGGYLAPPTIKSGSLALLKLNNGQYTYTYILQVNHLG